MAKTLELDPSRRVLMGSELGQEMRRSLGLDEADRADTPVTVRIGTPAVTSSFIAELIGPSVRMLGLAGFRKHYRFEAVAPVRDRIDWCAADVEAGLL